MGVIRDFINVHHHGVRFACSIVLLAAVIIVARDAIFADAATREYIKDNSLLVGSILTALITLYGVLTVGAKNAAVNEHDIQVKEFENLRQNSISMGEQIRNLQAANNSLFDTNMTGREENRKSDEVCRAKIEKLTKDLDTERQERIADKTASDTENEKLRAENIHQRAEIDELKSHVKLLMQEKQQPSRPNTRRTRTHDHDAETKP